MPADEHEARRPVGADGPAQSFGVVETTRPQVGQRGWLVAEQRAEGVEERVLGAQQGGALTEIAGLPDRRVEVIAQPCHVVRVAGRLRLLEIALAREPGKRFQTSLFVLFALVAFGLAIVGVYGVIAYGVSQRSAEIALRLTLGATKTGLVLDIMRRTAMMVGVGVLTGLAVALVSSRMLRSLLFEIAPTDPATYVVAAAGLLIAGVAAGGLAGLRATKVNPISALK